MKKNIKYLIIFIVFMASLILSISVYIEATTQKNIYAKSVKTIEEVAIDNYKLTLKNSIESSISYIDYMLDELIREKLKYLEDEVHKITYDLENLSRSEIDKFIKNYDNKNINLELFDEKQKYLVQRVIFLNNKKYLFSLNDNKIKAELVKQLRVVFYRVDSAKKQYIWINEVLNYEGGKNYAKRVIHPNLIDTEGSFLSTFTHDIKGNTPYLDELEGIKKDKEIYFRYFFKELNSNKITEKLSYAKLYKRLNWIVATGIPLNRLDDLIQTRKTFLSNQYEEHFKRISFFGFSTIVLFMILLYYLYKKISKYTKENLELEKKILETKMNKKYQKNIEKREEQYRYLMEATQDGVWDWNIITNEVYFSPQLKAMMGYKEDELENKLENWYENTHPDDREEIDKDVKDNLEGKSDFYINRHRVKCKDGSWIWIEDKGKVFFDEDGKPFRMIGSHRDITTEKYYQDMLVKKEKQYRELFYNNGSIILVVDPETKSVINSNKAAEKFYGYSHTEFKSLKVKDINTSEEKMIKSIFKKIIRGEEKEFYVKHRLKNGDIVDVKVFSTRTVFDDKLALYTIVQDMSEELKAKEDLKETVIELEKIKENLDFSQELFHIGSWEFDNISKELFLSKEVFNILEIKEKKISFDEYITFIHPDDKVKAVEDFEKSIQEKSSHNLEYRLLLNNGKIKYINERGENHYNKDGNYLKSVGTIYDTTRDTLIESNWKSFFSLSLDLLVIADYEGNIIKINPACETILGYEVEELIGKNLYDYLYDKDIDSTKKEAIEAINGKKIYNFENRYVNKNGDIVTIAWSAVASSEQNVIYSIGQDITELKNKNYMLAQQSKMAAMGEMLGNIAHQWRQPLSLISTLSTGAKLKKELGELPDDEFMSSMDSINNTTQFLSETIDDFRNFFHHNKEKSRFKISDIIQRTLKIISAQFTNHEINIIQSVEDCEIEALENEFLQVLVNILNNSRDALIEKRESERLILIDVKVEEKEIKIKIKDNAFGIDEEIINKIFEPYFTTKHQSQGTGIGLYMSEEIITKHMHGQIEVKNKDFTYEEKEYKGAEFLITLPLA